ncbi:MAG: hypothetical protein HQ565_10145 [Bacteroidetes bacterium]|nr:hypothetical protein [Bacteroidota bacterium]
MKTLILITLFLLVNPSSSDHESITKELDQLYFYIPTNADKYDVRKSLHLNSNLSDISEYKDWCNCFSADIIENSLLKYFGVNGRIVIWFDKETKLTKSRKLSFRYYPSDFDKCEKQLNDLYNTFNPISYKSESFQVTNYQDEKSGEGFWLFSTEANYKANIYYLDIGYRYIDASNTGDRSYYLFEIIYHEKNL